MFKELCKIVAVDYVVTLFQYFQILSEYASSDFKNQLWDISRPSALKYIFYFQQKFPIISYTSTPTYSET